MKETQKKKGEKPIVSSPWWITRNDKGACVLLVVEEDQVKEFGYVLHVNGSTIKGSQVTQIKITCSNGQITLNYDKATKTKMDIALQESCSKSHVSFGSMYCYINLIFFNN